LTAFQEQLLLTVYDLQRQYASGLIPFQSTVWSRSSYEMAKTFDRLRPAPVKGQHNIERVFHQRLKKAADQLISYGMARRRTIRTSEDPARFSQGYKRHRARGRDFFLTEKGLSTAETSLRARGRMAETAMAKCTDEGSGQGFSSIPMAGCDD
jgi:hypothetical protein